MNKLTTLLLSTILAIGIVLPAGASTPPAGLTSLSPMLKKTLPSVVNIATHGELPIIQESSRSRPSPQNPGSMLVPPKFDDFGSGVIVNADQGYIMTNAHLVKDAQIIMITLNDGRRMRARMVGYDAPSDIAILQINGKYLTEAPFGDSDKLNVGDFVAAIGSPFGLQQTVTSGVVSGLERTNLGIEGFENFIQTDAPINPGNSGGALVNMQGELIGINTAILSTSNVGGNIGIGFAIPSNMAKSVMEQLIKYGKVERGIIGVGVQNITPALASAMNLPNTEGALVSQIVPNSPADKAGIKVKDIIVALNGKKIHSALQISNTVGSMRVGTDVALELKRNGKTIKADMTIANTDELKKHAYEA